MSLFQAGSKLVWLYRFSLRSVMMSVLQRGQDNVESRDMRVSVNKTKVMISGERQNAVRWPCGVCGRGVGSN